MNDIQTTRLTEELGRYSRRIVDRGLVAGPGGNTSVRDGGTMWISPSGYSLDEIPSGSWVPIDIESGRKLQEGLRPSSEVDMHLAIYRRRSEVNAIVHTHPTSTIAVVSAGYNAIPYMFPDHVAVVGPLACIDYVVPCTPQLAHAVEEALGEATFSGLLMRNHGLITVGQTVREAYFRTEVVEDAAKAFWMAHSLGGGRVLTDREVDEILALEAEQYRQHLLKESLSERS